MINYMGQLMAGTTDEKCENTERPEAPDADVDFIIQNIKHLFPKDYNIKENIQGTFAGLRPLVRSHENDYHSP